jgi:hypothetical protein
LRSGWTASSSPFWVSSWSRSPPSGVAGLTATGNALALAIGFYTAAIGGLQYLGARRVSRRSPI